MDATRDIAAATCRKAHGSGVTRRNERVWGKWLEERQCSLTTKPYVW